MLLSLYLLVVSDIVNFTRMIPGYLGEPGSDIKDPRFFGTIAAFPALHLLLIWIRREQRPLALGPICLIGQAVVFAFVIQIRWPVIWLLIALYGYWFIRLLSSRRSPHQSPHSIRFLVPSLLFAAIVGSGTIATTITAHPIYQLDGDLLHHPLWHNA